MKKPYRNFYIAGFPNPNHLLDDAGGAFFRLVIEHRSCTARTSVIESIYSVSSSNVEN